MLVAPKTVSSNPEDDQIIAAFASIKKSIAANRQTITEELFVNVFLPFFKDSPEADPRVTMSTWYGVAGGAFNEVNVLDRSGAVLFAVPPVMSNKLVAPISREGGKALSSLLALSARRDKIIPGTGSALLTEGLKRFDFMADNATDVMGQYKTRWNEIMARYDTEGGKGDSNATNNTGDDGLDLFEF